jgi:hypothetical protein
MVLDGITSGLPKKMYRPVASGISVGLEKKGTPSLKPNECKVLPSATQFTAGVFGGGPTPQGLGDGKATSMKMVHKTDALVRRKDRMMEKKLEEHIVMHNM